MFSVNIKLNNPAGRAKKAVGAGQFALDEAALKDSNYYIPKDEGYLEESGVTHSKIGEGELIWQTKYARKLYYNPQYDFSTDMNPNAQGLWWEAAKAENLEEWLEQANKATKRKL
ncbi:Minor capsid protein [Virgibacillus subterraneus]|uniref:Minor capsid protein n=1 Tax=Virgibacillus subterraneus TaxID=621109 RepID=A0A1H8YZT1_9BACI|nr:minor capsid protein [Virgibacillus subterraneus]SEP56878.1 Minor capsid protein [Virgibacillus subterraneus]